MKDNIIIICFDKNVSKSVAKFLAEHENKMHADINEVLDSETTSIKKLLSIKGNEYFQKFEEELLNILNKFNNIVVSMDDNNILSEKILKKIKKNFKIVFLKQTKKELKKTILSPDDELVFDELNNLYEIYADVTLEAKNKNDRAICLQILEKLGI